MSQIQPRKFEDLAALQTAVLALLRDVFTEASQEDYLVMLSGGSTPLPVYAALASQPCGASERLHLTFSDDRHVPRDSPDSNYGNTAPLLDALGLPEERILGVNPDVSLSASAQEFERDLGSFFERGGRFSLALLGMGADTHTCSLFSEADLQASVGHLAIPVTKSEPPHRVSVTPAVLERAERVIFLVAGASKAAVIEQLLARPESTIAGQATAGCKHVEVWYSL